MTQPPHALPEPGPATTADVVDFGGQDRPTGRLRRPVGLRDPRLGWVLGGLGAVALFASLAGEWATTTYRWGVEEESVDEVVVGAGNAGSWGGAYLVGVLALAAAVGLVLRGPAHVRATARAVGLAVAGPLLLVLVAATIDFGSGSYPNLASADIDVEVTLQRGLYAAYPAVALFAAALWLAPTDHRPGGEAAPQPWSAPRQPGASRAGGPAGDLTVAPAEPFAHPTNDHEWR